MANDMAKLIAKYVNPSEDLHELYIRRRKRRGPLDRIETFNQNIRSTIYNGGHSFTISDKGYESIVIEEKVISLLDDAVKKYVIKSNNSSHKTTRLVANNTNLKIIIDHAKTLNMHVFFKRVFNSDVTSGDDYIIYVDWFHWK